MNAVTVAWGGRLKAGPVLGAPDGRNGDGQAGCPERGSAEEHEDADGALEVDASSHVTLAAEGEEIVNHVKVCGADCLQLQLAKGVV